MIILDLEMPRMDGITFLRKLMRETPTPVIVCSSHIGDGGAQAVRALEAGALELIAKPSLGVPFLNDSALMLVDAVRAAASVRFPPRSVSVDAILPPPSSRPTARSQRRRAFV